MPTSRRIRARADVYAAGPARTMTRVGGIGRLYYSDYDIKLPSGPEAASIPEPLQPYGAEAQDLLVLDYCSPVEDLAFPEAV